MALLWAEVAARPGEIPYFRDGASSSNFGHLHLRSCLSGHYPKFVTIEVRIHMKTKLKVASLSFLPAEFLFSSVDVN